ncbi:MAG: M14 family metallopeptidase [Candidatus Zixiibacteriota bacterium]
MVVTFLASILCLGSYGWTADADFTTVAEQSGYRLTASYDETVDYVRRLEAASPWVKVTVFGQSPQGRDLHCVVVSREGAFTPTAARTTGKVIVLIQNGIHSGEIDGKDACMALLRDICITKSRASLLDSTILLIIPIFNVDGHEINARDTRANQDGPENAGFRTTAQWLNLNRDYMKADAPEMQAWLRLWREWMPDFFIDDHVSDGGDWQYLIQYTMPWHPNAAPSLRRWTRETFDPDVTARTAAAGIKIFPYAFFRGPLSAGVMSYVESPRFSTGYTALWNRPGLLVETHSLAPYRERVLGNHTFLVAVLENISQNATSLKQAIAQADAAMADGVTDSIPFRFQSNGDSTMIDFYGYAVDSAQSAASGEYYPIWDHARPVTTRIPFFGTNVPRLQVAPPRAYLIPREWMEPVARLRLHGVHLDTLRVPWTGAVQMYYLDSAKWGREPYESRFSVTYRTTRHDTVATFPAGTIVVGLRQPAAKVAVHLLEPQGSDALVAWGFWNSIFEQKEYIEDYVIDPLADSMLAHDADLRAAFETRLASDTAFARSPWARRSFFYRRTRFAETQIGWYPVARLVGPIPPTDPLDKR